MITKLLLQRLSPYLLSVSLIVNCEITLAQEEPVDLNVSLFNSTNENIYLKVYPVSMVFNGFNKYDLTARYTFDPPNNVWGFIGATNRNLRGQRIRCLVLCL